MCELWEASWLENSARFLTGVSNLCGNLQGVFS